LKAGARAAAQAGDLSNKKPRTRAAFCNTVIPGRE
jgi:hypothetical protein